jgi:hypothetical protein
VRRNNKAEWNNATRFVNSSEPTALVGVAPLDNPGPVSAKVLLALYRHHLCRGFMPVALDRTWITGTKFGCQEIMGRDIPLITCSELSRISLRAQ